MRGLALALSSVAVERSISKPREATVSQSKGKTYREAVKAIPESGPPPGSFLLESQELNLVDQDRFIGLLSTDSDPVSAALSI